MSSQDDHDGHRDAAADREVVICHACSHERHRDQHGLMCPEYHGEITEIDPHHLDHHPSASTSTETGPCQYRDGDFEAEQGNIDSQLGSHGLGFQRSVRDGPDWRHHHDPAVELAREYFLGSNHGIAPLRRPRRPTRFRSSLSGRPSEHDLFPPHIYRITLTTEPLRDGVTSMPIVPGPIHGSRGGPLLTSLVTDLLAQPPPRRSQRRIGHSFGALGANQIARTFSDVLRDAGTSGEDNQRGDEGPGAGPTSSIRSLHNILSLHHPANVMFDLTGYVQHALAGVNTQSNAALPATEEALRDLKRKPVDKEMLGTEGKAECVICIDEMKEEDMATILPCKHWFHEDCVVPWLRKHNTCPICRTPIEENHRGGNNSNSNSGSDNNGSSRPRGIVEVL